MRIYSLVLLLMVLSACATNDKFTIVQDISSSHADCADLNPIPEQIYSMRPLYEAAVTSGKQYGNESILVLFDIDNTMLASTKLLGSDQWFSWRYDVLKESNEMSEFGCLLEAQNLLYHRGSMRLTDRSVGAVIDRLQSQGFMVAVLTSRGPNMQLVTLRDLYSNGLEFVESSPKDWFEEYTDSSQPVRYEYGVFMTSGRNKGEMATLLIKNTGIDEKVKKVFFVDDKTRHVCAVQKSLGEIGVSVETFHYPVEDKYVAPVERRESDVIEKLNKEWDSTLKSLSCRSERCVSAASKCEAAWKKYQ